MKLIMILTGTITLALCSYFFPSNTLYILAGTIWGLINLYFIKQLLYELLLKTPKNLLKIALLTLIKFPILYGLGFGLLYYQKDIPWALLIGFSGVLILSTQKWFWKAVFSNPNSSIEPLEKKGAI